MSDQRLYPMLAYADAKTAIELLCRAFGFVEESRYDMADGRVGHAELSLEGTVVMLADAYPELGLASPREMPALTCQLLVYVDDVDAHFARAEAEGAVVVNAPVDDHGARMYRALDGEGHRWLFASRREDAQVADEESTVASPDALDREEA